MSYILDALRRSESERRQGRVPDLGQQVQFVHKPRKKSSTLTVWIVAALMLNAVVLALVFFWPAAAPQNRAPAPDVVAEKPEAADEARNTEPAPDPKPEPEPLLDPKPVPEPVPEAAPEPITQERPTIIVPSRLSEGQSQPYTVPESSSGSVPHLVEMPREFQQSIPDLVFNSHIYASEPSSRRVMINNNYLKAGDSFDGLRVQQITEEGVVLSKNGRSFRVGSMRDWVSPN